MNVLWNKELWGQQIESLCQTSKQKMEMNLIINEIDT